MTWYTTSYLLLPHADLTVRTFFSSADEDPHVDYRLAPAADFLKSEISKVVEQCLPGDPELSGGGAAIALVSFERLSEKAAAKITLRLFPRPRNLRCSCGDWKVFRLDNAPTGSDECDLDRLPQLADIPRPVVLAQDRFRFRAPRTRFDPVAVQCFALEEVHEDANILPAFTQRGDEDRWRGDSIIEILTKPTLANAPPEVLMGRGDDPGVDDSRLAGTHRPNLLALQKAKEFDLQRRVEVTDFVEKQRPLVRRNREALARSIGSRVGTLDGAEQLGLQQAGRDRGDVDRDKSPAPP